MALISWNNTSYNTTRADILARAAQGLGYDYDGYYGYQCWDLGANWYAIIGLSFRTKNSYTGAGGDDSYVYTTWTYQPAFQNNSQPPMIAITDVTLIKRGDMVIWGAEGTIAISGHNGFADEDYNNGKTTLRTLGQNQQDPNFLTGHIPTLNDLPKQGILGAFRYSAWEGGPGPEPEPEPIGAIVRPKTGNMIIYKRALQKRGRKL